MTDRRLPPILRFRIAMAAVIAGLVLSGVTAFPLLHEIRLLTHLLGLRDGASPSDHERLYRWILTVRTGLEASYARYPWIAYGTGTGSPSSIWSWRCSSSDLSSIRGRHGPI